VILSFSLWHASKPMRELISKVLFCCAVLVVVSLSGLVLLVNYLIVSIGSLLQKKSGTHDRYG
jgi:hypothetical protein